MEWWLALLNEVRVPGAHAPNFSMTDCDESFIKKGLVDWNILHVYVQEEERAVVSRDVIDGEESKTVHEIILRGYPWRSRCAKASYMRTTPPNMRDIQFVAMEERMSHVLNSEQFFKLGHLFWLRENA